MPSVVVYPKRGHGGFWNNCGSVLQFPTEVPKAMAPYIEDSRFEFIMIQINRVLKTKVNEGNNVRKCGCALCFIPFFQIPACCLFVKAGDVQGECRAKVQSILLGLTNEEMSWKFHLTGNEAEISIHIMDTAIPRETRISQISPKQDAMELLEINVTLTAEQEKELDQEKERLSALAKSFVPPAHLEEMIPYIERLKVFEKKLDVAPGPTHEEEKEATEIFNEVRKILKREADNAGENPKVIGAAFMEVHGGHIQVYNAGHSKGSGSDKDHEAVVDMLKKLAVKCKEKNPNPQQSTLDPIILVKQAVELKDDYLELVNKLAEECDAEVELPAGRLFKGIYRIVEKSAMRAGEMQNMCNNVFDVLRGMLIFKTDEAIGKAVTRLGELAEIVRVKERLHNLSRTSEGWGDVMVNFRLKIDDKNKKHSVGTEHHICEIQFARLEMFTMRKTLGGHHEYFIFRASLELHEVNKLSKPTDLLSNTIQCELDAAMDDQRFDACSALQTMLSTATGAELEIEKKKEEIENAQKAKDFKTCGELKGSITSLERLLRKTEAEMRLVVEQSLKT